MRPLTHRFFIPPNWIEPPTVRLQGQTARQVRTVLRMKPGDEIVVLDNSGMEWRVSLTQVDKTEVHGQIIDRQPARGEPELHLTLYQGTLKAQKFEWVLQKGTELGIGCFVPTLCRRSVVNNREALAKKRERWERIIREAAEQSGRGLLPRLEPAMPLAEAMRFAASNTLVLMLWEQAVGSTLKEVLDKTRPRSVGLFIGPEGGFTEDEVVSARQCELQIVKLGPRILRAETAGLVAASAIFYGMGEWD